MPAQHTRPMSLINQFSWFLAQMGDKAAEKAPDPNQAADPGFFGNILMFAPAILMVMLVYFLLSGRPQQKQQAKSKELLENLKKNDRVLTAGGILGTVVNIREDNDYVTLRVDEGSNTRMQILTTSIVKVIKDEDKNKND